MIVAADVKLTRVWSEPSGLERSKRLNWTRTYIERVIGSIRRECLEHIVIFNERHPRRVLSSYVDCYQDEELRINYSCICDLDTHRVLTIRA